MCQNFRKIGPQTKKLEPENQDPHPHHPELGYIYFFLYDTTILRIVVKVIVDDNYYYYYYIIAPRGGKVSSTM